MGILASVRKRGDYVSPQCDVEEDWISKRRRFSNSTIQSDSRAICSVAAFKIFHPLTKPGYRKRVHAPIRNSRFSRLSKQLNLTSGKFMENHINTVRRFQRYAQTKEGTISSLRWTGKDLDKRIDRQDDVPEDVSNKNVETVELGGIKRIQEQTVAENSHEDMNTMIIGKTGSFESSVVLDEVHVILKEGATSDMESRKLDHMSDSTEPVYKRMLKEIYIRSGKIDWLKSLTEFVNDKLKFVRSTRPSRKEKVLEYFTPLTKEEEIEVSEAMSNRNRFRVLVAHESSNVDITGEKLQCLRNGAWLNDEVINLYLALLKEREKREPGKFLKCHYFNTFFYKKLISGRDGYDFRSVRRWTTQKKLGYGLLECEKIFVPIHREVHWCLAIINKKAEKFQYLDSLQGYDPKVLNVLARYFVDEVKDKCGQDIDVSSWEHEFVSDLPEQENGYDCGVFMIKYADFHSRGIDLCFSQHHMQYFRRRTAKEILKLRAE